MTLGDRFGQEADRPHRTDQASYASGRGTGVPFADIPADGGTLPGEPPRPAFGPEPPRPYRPGAAFPGPTHDRLRPGAPGHDRPVLPDPGPDRPGAGPGPTRAEPYRFDPPEPDSDDPIDRAFASWFAEPDPTPYRARGTDRHDRAAGQPRGGDPLTDASSWMPRNHPADVPPRTDASDAWSAAGPAGAARPEPSDAEPFAAGPAGTDPYAADPSGTGRPAGDPLVVDPFGAPPRRGNPREARPPGGTAPFRAAAPPRTGATTDTGPIDPFADATATTGTPDEPAERIWRDPSANPVWESSPPGTGDATAADRDAATAHERGQRESDGRAGHARDDRAGEDRGAGQGGRRGRRRRARDRYRDALRPRGARQRDADDDAGRSDGAGQRGTGEARGSGEPRGTDEPHSGEPDEVLPPTGDRRTGDRDAHPKMLVAALQPATVYQPVDGAAEPAGEPPSQARAAAVLSGLLALPMLATAGTLLGGVSEGTGSFGVLLPLMTLLLAACCVLGGVRLLSRGSPLVPLFNATLVVIVGAGSLFRLLTPSVLDALLAGLWVLAVPMALAMVALLRARRVRRWLSDRSREWQAGRPVSRRRRLRLPELPRVRMPRLGRLLRRRGRPTRVRQVGRHTRGPRFGFPRRGPVRYVGSDSPDAGRAGD